MKKKDIRLIVFTVVITSIFGLINSLTVAYFSTPSPSPWIPESSRCIRELYPYINNTYKIDVNNFGEVTGVFQACISLNGFNSCTFQNDPLQPTITPQLIFSTPFTFKVDTGGDEKQNISFTITILCKQKVWFLEKVCNPFSYSCNYERVGSFKHYNYRLTQNSI